MSRIAWWAAILTLLVGVAACSTEPQHPFTPVPLQPAPETLVPASPGAAPTPALSARVVPTHLVIPSIGVDTRDFMKVGLDHGVLQTPSLKQPKTLAWYVGSPPPGEKPLCSYAQHCVQDTVIDGHINADGVEGTFADLAKLSKGARVAVGRSDGKTAHYTVTDVLIFDKSKFPTDRIYNGGADLVLITCGPFGLVRTASGGNYAEQTTVLARLTSVTG